jgi:hypothetical protein
MDAAIDRGVEDARAAHAAAPRPGFADGKPGR